MFTVTLFNVPLENFNLHMWFVPYFCWVALSKSKVITNSRTQEASESVESLINIIWNEPVFLSISQFLVIWN